MPNKHRKTVFEPDQLAAMRDAFRDGSLPHETEADRLDRAQRIVEDASIEADPTDGVTPAE